VFAPLKTPPDIVKRMHDEIEALQNTPEVVQKLEQQARCRSNKRRPSSASTCRMKRRAGRWVIDKAGIKGE
jgi:tripartite-type tricarboxylate transporter receptor subunit TctC